MLRNIKTDLYRLFTSFEVYLFPIAVVLIDVALFIAKFIFGAEIEAGGGNIYLILGDFMANQLLAIVSGIVFAIYLAKEYKEGYIKNIAGSMSGRFMQTVSKYITGIVLFFGYYIFTSVEGAVRSLIFEGGIDTDISYVSENFIFFGPGAEGDVAKVWWAWLLTAILLHIMLMTLILLCTELTRGKTLGCIAGIIIPLGVVDVLIEQFFLLMQNVLGWFEGFEIEAYLPFEHLRPDFWCKPEIDIRPIVTAGVLMVIYFGLSAYIHKKKDI